MKGVLFIYGRRIAGVFFAGGTLKAALLVEVHNYVRSNAEEHPARSSSRSMRSRFKTAPRRRSTARRSTEPVSCPVSCRVPAATPPAPPTAQTVDAKLQESDDGATGWTDIAGAAIATLTADETAGGVDVNLSGAKAFVRVVATVGFTAGTTPAIPVAASLILGGADELPA